MLPAAPPPLPPLPAAVRTTTIIDLFHRQIDVIVEKTELEPLVATPPPVPAVPPAPIVTVYACAVKDKAVSNENHHRLLQLLYFLRPPAPPPPPHMNNLHRLLLLLLSSQQLRIVIGVNVPLDVNVCTQ
jgi:hypothetical protein